MSAGVDLVGAARCPAVRELWLSGLGITGHPGRPPRPKGYSEGTLYPGVPFSRQHLELVCRVMLV